MITTLLQKRSFSISRVYPSIDTKHGMMIPSTDGFKYEIITTLLLQQKVSISI